MSPHPKIKTFAIFDLETSGLPAFNFNKASITELSIYGILAKNIVNDKNINDEKSPAKIAKQPRILHKLNLLFNPQMLIHPGAEEVTGLNNYMLENESTFDTNAANIIVNFIKHLQQPVCLVAHNGWNFDFPILKQMLNKVQVQLPSTVVCVDSFAAFKDIDNARDIEIELMPVIGLTDETAIEKTQAEELNSVEDTITVEAYTTANDDLDEITVDIKMESVTDVHDVLVANDQINWRAINETTPKRSTHNAVKRKRSNELDNENTTPENSPVKTAAQPSKSRRNLFASKIKSSPKYSPKGFYKLSSVYERIFQKTFADAHHAEADVNALAKILQHYGQDFLDYANHRARPFDQVLRVGDSFNNF